MTEITTRDRVWAALVRELDQPGTTQVKIDHIDRGIDFDRRPSRTTIRRTLRAATELGILSHREGSPWFKDAR